jgi:hypothetical protein
MLRYVGSEPGRVAELGGVILRGFAATASRGRSSISSEGRRRFPSGQGTAPPSGAAQRSGGDPFATIDPSIDRAGAVPGASENACLGIERSRRTICDGQRQADPRNVCPGCAAGPPEAGGPAARSVVDHVSVTASMSSPRQQKLDESGHTSGQECVGLLSAGTGSAYASCRIAPARLTGGAEERRFDAEDVNEIEVHWAVADGTRGSGRHGRVGLRNGCRASIPRPIVCLSRRQPHPVATGRKLLFQVS